MRDTSFQQLGAACAILAGVTGFLYAVAFLIVSRASPDAGRLWSGVFLLAGGILSLGALIALYERLRRVSEGAALWALLLGVAGVLGAAVHGGYDLAVAIHPSAAGGETANAPSPIDPRGLLTFGVTGLALFIDGALIAGGASLPRGLSSIAYLQGALLLVLYLARLIVLAPSSPAVAVPAILAGFVTGPVWYVSLGLALRGSAAGEPAALAQANR
jgi:hypothetical protein